MAQSFSVTEIDQLIRDMVPMGDVLDEGKKSVFKGAMQIKEDWRKRWSGHPHIPRLPAAVTFDIGELGFKVEAEIGPDKDRPQGALGNIIEFGTPKNAPIPGGLPALEAEVPRFEKAIADLGEKLLPK